MSIRYDRRITNALQDSLCAGFTFAQLSRAVSEKDVCVTLHGTGGHCRVPEEREDRVQLGPALPAYYLQLSAIGKEAAPFLRMMR